MCVTVNCCFEIYEGEPANLGNKSDVIFVEAFALAENDASEESIEKAKDAAISKCYKMAEGITTIGTPPPREVRRELMRNLVRKSLGRVFEEKAEKLKAAGKEDSIEKLYGKATASHQKMIDTRCEELGFETIDVLSEPVYSVIEAYTLIAELESKISDSQKVPFDFSKLGG